MVQIGYVKANAAQLVRQLSMLTLLGITAMLWSVAAYADNLAPLNPFQKLADPTQGVLAVQTTFEPENDRVRVIVYDNEADFLTKTVAKMDGQLDETGLALFPLKSMSNGRVDQGEYAFAVYLDENGDGKLNRNFLGQPKEPYKFSNHVKAKLSRPSFEETKIEVKPGEVLVITLDD